MRKLNIAQVSPLWFRVPPKGFGGVELIVSRLTEGLVKRGHKVTLFASGDSKTKAKLVSVVKKNLSDLKIPLLASGYSILNLIETFSRQEEFDIIHSHIDKFDFIFRAHAKVPTISTLHNPIWPYPLLKKTKSGLYHDTEGVLSAYARFPKLPYIAISNNYIKNCPIRLNFIKTIYPGVDIKRLKFNPKPEDYFVWLGRISPVKGLHIAIKIAKKLGIKLLIGGCPIREENQEYLEKEIKPHFSKKIKFLGEIKSDKEKSELLGNAKALIYPLLWEEPFGLVMIESQACGTPVIAFKRGSVEELVKHNVTGLVCKTEKEMIKAIKKIDNLERIECRKWVEKNFTIEKMVENHEKLYYQLIEKFHR